jgi:WD40 repeat protein
MRYLDGHDGVVTSVAFSPDGTTLAAVATRGPALFWDLNDDAPARGYPDPTASVVVEGFTRVAWSQEPGILALGRPSGDVDIVEIATGTLKAQFTGNILAPVTGLAFFNGGRLLVISCGGAEDDTGALYVVARDKGFRRVSPGTLVGTSFGAAAATPRGKVCFYVDKRRQVFRWDLTSPDQRKTNTFGKPIRSLALSPDEKMLAITEDYAIQLYDAESMQRIRTLTGHIGRVDALAFTPDGRHLAAGSWDKTVRFWDPATGHTVAAHDWEIGQVRTLAFSPDGLLAAAAGDRGTIVLWDVDL